MTTDDRFEPHIPPDVNNESGIMTLLNQLSAFLKRNFAEADARSDRIIERAEKRREETKLILDKMHNMEHR